MTRYLLDTHVWLWLLASPERVDPAVLDRLQDADNDLFLSAASSWEIAIKHRLGKLTLPEPPERYVPDRMRRTGTTSLAIEHSHALAVGLLPDHHRDPFDRLIVAQAIATGMAVVTADPLVAAYDAPIVWAGATP